MKYLMAVAPPPGKVPDPLQICSAVLRIHAGPQLVLRGERPVYSQSFYRRCIKYIISLNRVK